jgi:hydrogenase small subunit
MVTVEFVPRQKETEQITAHLILMTSELSCDGGSVGMTSATSPSLEDIVLGIIPGMPKVMTTVDEVLRG